MGEAKGALRVPFASCLLNKRVWNNFEYVLECYGCQLSDTIIFSNDIRSMETENMLAISHSPEGHTDNYCKGY